MRATSQRRPELHRGDHADEDLINLLSFSSNAGCGVPMAAVPWSERRCLPMTWREVQERGFKELDIIIVTGDAYVDHPSFGAAVIGRVLEAAGYKVGIIAQPDWKSAEAFRALGRPRLFFGITAGNLDSMVNHYTAHRRPRRDDAFSEDGQAGRRPDRAATVYAHRCREAFKDVPIVLGGVEASLRRLAHYDYWDNCVRRSILLDAKADLLVYGQGERPVLEIANRLDSGIPVSAIDDIPGTVVVRKDLGDLPDRLQREALILPSFEQVREDQQDYARFSRLFHLEQNLFNARLLVQPHGNRLVVALPRPPPFTTEQLDQIYRLPYTRAPHPYYQKKRIPAWEQIRLSVQIVRGCSAGCSFCSLTEHQGRDISSRSEDSIIFEIEELKTTPYFTGTISDLGGPTANLWKMGCFDQKARQTCRRVSCIFPKICPNFNLRHGPLTSLYRRARRLDGVKHVFIASGIRYDLIRADSNDGAQYLKELVGHHVSGQLKVAPEHVSQRVLQLMHKPSIEVFDWFRNQFKLLSNQAGKEQYLIPYFISSHPGSGLEDAAELHDYLRVNHWKPQQVQDFMPTPMTLATDMFYTGINPMSMEPVLVERDLDGKRMQKALLCWGSAELKPWYQRAMKRLNRKVR